MAERRPARRPSPWRVVVAAVGLVALVSGCTSTPSGPFAGQVLDSPFTMPAVTLTDDEGAAFSLTDDTDKRLTLVFFGYVDCVDECPAVLNALASGITKLDDEDADQVQVVLVSSDPERDTPARLHDYLAAIDPTDDGSWFTGLTGEWGGIEQVAESLSVFLDRNDPGAHQTLIFGLDVDDRVPVYWHADTTPKQYADDIHSLLKDS